MRGYFGFCEACCLCGVALPCAFLMVVCLLLWLRVCLFGCVVLVILPGVLVLVLICGGLVICMLCCIGCSGWLSFVGGLCDISGSLFASGVGFLLFVFVA